MKVFIPVVGQFINIGDTLHRKILISWLKETDSELHLFVGNASESFVDALQLRSSDVIYTNLFNWLFSLMFLDFLRKKHFIFNPGELTFSFNRLLKELLLLPFYIYIRMCNGKVLRIGVAAQSNIIIKRKWLWRIIFKTTNKIYWRTIKSQSIFDTGEVIPDLAFYDINLKINYEEKNLIVISMRGDRELPSKSWFEGIIEFSSKHNLDICVVSQVKIDNNRTIEIAKKLNAPYYEWKDSLSHREQEEIVNEIYQRSKIAISDRLHVLIAAFTKGTIPADIPVLMTNKVQDHFDVLRLNNVTLTGTDVTKDKIYAFLAKKYSKSFDVNLMLQTKSRLEEVKQEVIKDIS